MTLVSTKERLARIEANLEQLAFDTRQLHGDLRSVLEMHGKDVAAQEVRIRSLEQTSEQTRTHLRWMKAAFVAAQATVFAWIGWNK